MPCNVQMQQKVLQPGMRVPISYMEQIEQSESKSFFSISLPGEQDMLRKTTREKRKRGEKGEKTLKQMKTSKQMGRKSKFFFVFAGVKAMHVKMLIPVEV